jgi:hypothetical protein
MFRRLAAALFAAAFLSSAPARAAEPDYSDIWWAAGATESGWGVNFAQSPGFIFATFFIYDQDGKQVWVSAEMIQIAAGRYSGALYRCTGTFYGSPWVPGNAGCTQVGDAQFTAENLFRGSLAYRVDAVQVNKTIERLALTPLDVAGTYLGGALIKGSSSCNGGSYSDILSYQYIVKSLANSVIRIEHVRTDSVTDCVMQGTAIQAGKVLQMSGASYVCQIYGIDTTATITDLRKTSNGGIQASWTADLGSGCTENGNFAAINQE